MSKIQELTTFMREDVANMQKQAEELNVLAVQLRENFKAVVEMARSQLDQASNDLSELRASLAGSNNPPQA